MFATGEEEGTKYWPSRSLFVTEGSCPVRRSFAEAEAAPEFAPATLAASASGEGGAEGRHLPLGNDGAKTDGEGGCVLRKPKEEHITCEEKEGRRRRSI